MPSVKFLYITSEFRVNTPKSESCITPVFFQIVAMIPVHIHPRETIAVRGEVAKRTSWILLKTCEIAKEGYSPIFFSGWKFSDA